MLESIYRKDPIGRMLTFPRRLCLELIRKFQVAPNSLSNTFVALLKAILIISLDQLPRSKSPIFQILHGETSLADMQTVSVTLI